MSTLLAMNMANHRELENERRFSVEQNDELILKPVEIERLNIEVSDLGNPLNAIAGNFRCRASALV
ncbi:MAG TPA: hypothetical protein VLM38_10180 [Blastocatellia bacterium]|nr:hypothetical protein [Blastocatellia bacterium]